MTIATHPETYRPLLRPDIQFGPPLIIRGNTAYVMKDNYTHWYYEISMVEYFVLSKMDGNHTLSEIEANIEQHYGHGLNEHSWEALFKQIDQRQLLSDHVESDKLEALKVMDKRRRWSEHQTLLRHRLSLTHPDSFLKALLPWMNWAFHPFFVLPAIVAIFALEIYILLNFRILVLEAWNSHVHTSAISVYTIFVILLCILPIFHEFSHGLACRRFGGSITEIGVIWRFMSFFPYCKLDDIVLFHNRWHRVYAAFAGTFFSLVVLIPCGILWFVTPEMSPLRIFSALMLTVYNLGMLINFLPFLELDGYFMLAHALDMPDLRQASNEFWGRKLVKLLSKQAEITHHAHNFGHRGTRIYYYYGIVSIVLTALVMADGILSWFTTIRGIVGDTITWIAMGGLILYVLYRLGAFTYRLLAIRRGASHVAHIQTPIKTVGISEHAIPAPITDVGTP